MATRSAGYLRRWRGQYGSRRCPCATPGISNAQSSDYWIKIPCAANFTAIPGSLRQMSSEEISACVVIADDYLENLKFRDCLPADLGPGCFLWTTLAAHSAGR